ncbi:hypothetical protein [Methylotetracoccus oryzae]|uniref:hypothetical protein n=1 Tax=Methylotetracoccus oryzae TaxID=1919059 RepID=UPI0011185DB4|nr:hypothetical protein [Methylotetracoccus oryzae]
MYRNNHLSKIIAAVIAVGGIYSAESPATSSGGSPKLDAYVSEADFIFRGTVDTVKYELSEPTGPDSAQLPFTFVTFKVSTAMKGAPAGKTVTLRFLGGLDPRTGLFMTSDQTPLFDVGDEDIVFAKKGGTLSSLVRNKEGRFRVIGDQVYSNEGQEVTIDKGKSVHTGKRHAFQEVVTTDVAGRTMSFQSHAKAEAPGTPSNAMRSDAFAQAIVDTVAKSPVARLEAFSGDDPQAALPKIDMTPAAPPSAH